MIQSPLTLVRAYRHLRRMKRFQDEAQELAFGLAGMIALYYSPCRDNPVEPGTQTLYAMYHRRYWSWIARSMDG